MKRFLSLLTIIILVASVGVLTGCGPEIVGTKLSESQDMSGTVAGKLTLNGSTSVSYTHLKRTIQLYARADTCVKMKKSGCPLLSYYSSSPSSFTTSSKLRVTGFFLYSSIASS